MTTVTTCCQTHDGPHIHGCIRTDRSPNGDHAGMCVLPDAGGHAPSPSMHTPDCIDRTSRELSGFHVCHGAPDGVRQTYTTRVPDPRLSAASYAELVAECERRGVPRAQVETGTPVSLADRVRAFLGVEGVGDGTRPVGDVLVAELWEAGAYFGVPASEAYWALYARD